MAKTPEMNAVVDSLAQALFGRKREEGKCISCGCDVDPLTGFKDELSRREYGISGMCQKCQDSVFDAPEE